MNSNPSPEDSYTISSDAMLRELDDESIILDLRTEHYFAVNPIGSFIWHAIERGDVLGRIAARLATEFEVDEDEAKADLYVFVDQLDARGLITRNE